MIEISSRLGTGALCILGAIAAYWLGLNISQARADRTHPHPDSPRPAWVRANGSVDLDKMPDCLPALGANGETLIDSAGKAICIAKRDLVGPPQAAPDVKNPDEISRRVDADGHEQVIVGAAKRRDQK